MTTVHVPPEQWIFISLLSLITFILNSIILIQERAKRRQNKVLFASRYLSLFSYSCIALGPFVALSLAFRYINGLCLMFGNIDGILYVLQYAAMECYQLSRIYYCFSSDATHSKHGYPNAVFVVMFTWLFVIVLLGVALLDVANPVTTCYVNETIGAVIKHETFLDNIWLYFYVAMTALMLALDDIATVMLYICKIHSLRVYDNLKTQEVYLRIQSILYRVVILTFLYQLTIMWATATLVFIVYKFKLTKEMLVCGSLFESLAFSVSMYLMQDHNTAEYVKFLQIVNKYKLYLCCCCCFRMVKDQHRIMISMDHTHESRLMRKKSNTIGDSENKSAEQSHQNKTGMELSVETVTVIYQNQEQK